MVPYMNNPIRFDVKVGGKVFEKMGTFLQHAIIRTFTETAVKKYDPIPASVISRSINSRAALEVNHEVVVLRERIQHFGHFRKQHYFFSMPVQ